MAKSVVKKSPRLRVKKVLPAVPRPHRVVRVRKISEREANQRLLGYRHKRSWTRTLGWFFVIALGGFLVVNYQYVFSQGRLWFGARTAVYYNKPDVSAVKPTYVVPNRLKISSLNIDAPVMYPTGSGEEVLQTALENGVAHYPGTAMPGQEGNVYIFGHSSDYASSPGKFKTVFALLPQINIGDSISLSSEEGEEFIYIVTNKFIAEKTDSYLLESITGKKTLTLQTSYPIGTALKRYVVKAELIN